jgi:hypothetical protein
MAVRVDGVAARVASQGPRIGAGARMGGMWRSDPGVHASLSFSNKIALHTLQRPAPGLLSA